MTVPVPARAGRAPDLLRWAEDHFPDRPCVVDETRSLSFREVSERAGRLADGFRRAGLVPGDRVALLAFNEVEYFEIQVATLRAGMILVPLNFRLTVPELTYMVNDSQPRLLISGPGLHDTAAALDVEQQWFFGGVGPGRDYDDVLKESDQPIGPRPVAADTPCIIQYTSGTTGQPKGAVTAAGAFFSRLDTFAHCSGLRPGDVFVQPLPLFHSSAGLSYTFTYLGCTNVLVRQFSPADVLARMEASAASHVLLAPTMLTAVLEHPGLVDAKLDSLRTVMYGASAIAPNVLRKAMTAFGSGFWQGYGMTEVGSISALEADDHDPEGHPELLTSCGREAPGMQVRIVDTEGRDVPAGEVGEILCSGPGLMSGYWNAPEATAEVLVDGWLHTGDLAYRDPDGYIFMTDRLKDTIVSGGENVYPREIENVLYDHPHVVEAAVVGIPSDRWGEAVHAVVVVRPGEQVTADDLIAHCRAALAGYKVPKSIDFTDDLPKLSTGKILRRVVKEQYWKGAGRRIG